ncbi:Nitroreductase [Mucilaginibacter lappiensis]|uniref:Nitroreductase n=1 Tax=Mucilaginibacter lappiensis TaxID=354630 RepID=A0ABR6PEV6_9SPHI|nr:nitroreductase family protein [Mucilaginibacter lappiensis]MBB6107774.1 nitroreductase [Mucilaginibacter lappiensis]SIP97592.1 Nitroreductase [Mucilaginibacter lappiensis]
MDIIQALNWRYATKRMTGQTVPKETIAKIIEAAHLAPSGIGLQPYEIIVVTNPEWKAKILPVAMNQPQVTQSSHLLVFAAWQNYSAERIHGVFDYLNEQRNQPASVSDNHRNFALKYFGQLSEEEQFHHAAKQANIALGLAVAAAALEQVDATPMEGFNAAALDELLGLKAKGLRSSMLMAIGYRDEENDKNLKLKKVRKPLSQLVTELA